MKAYKRILLKLSGEALAGDRQHGFDEDTCIGVAKQVKQLVDEGIQVSIVTGGGNFWRGRTSEAIDRTKADQIGMLATVMNCIYVSEILRSVGVQARVFTPFACGSMTRLFSKDDVLDFMKQGGVALLAGGTGHPYFSTDTAAVLRAIELDCDIILMAKSIDAVYDSDPRTNPEAKRYSMVTFQEMLSKELKVIDLPATALCIDNKMPMRLFNLADPDSIVKAAQGKSSGTVITA